jgi:hypothetical protein
MPYTTKVVKGTPPMNMTPKRYFFFDEYGAWYKVIASCLAAATAQLPADFQYDYYEVHK